MPNRYGPSAMAVLLEAGGAVATAARASRRGAGLDWPGHAPPPDRSSVARNSSCALSLCERLRRAIPCSCEQPAPQLRTEVAERCGEGDDAGQRSAPTAEAGVDPP